MTMHAKHATRKVRPCLSGQDFDASIAKETRGAENVDGPMEIYFCAESRGWLSIHCFGRKEYFWQPGYGAGCFPLPSTSPLGSPFCSFVVEGTHGSFEPMCLLVLN
eukprot:1156467-Pelagomonas_calceolata.AAC.1